MAGGVVPVSYTHLDVYKRQTFTMGTRKVYDFVNDNPNVVFMDVAFVNDTAVIRKNPKVAAINLSLIHI